jgi:hypothetical protein
MNTKIDELFATLRGLVSDQSRDLAIAMAELDNIGAQRDKALTERDNARQSLRASEQDVEELDTNCNDFRRANARLIAERDAMQTDNGILREVNLRLVADLAAATQRADTAEAILRAKA